MSHINYETDPLKHYVRKYGWLAASQQQKLAIKRRSKRIPLRYFTFCAAEAIDVFMLEQEQILRRSEETERLESVYFCEANSESFGIIADLIGSPEQGFRGEFERIVLFEDDADTTGKTVTDEAFYPSQVREKLRYKDAHDRLREAFPFDIINLDVFGVMFPARKGIITPLLKSVARILEWQTSSRFPINEQPCNQFTLFLTSHIDPDLTDQAAIEQLENRIINNISTSAEFQSAFVERYQHNQVDKLLTDNFAEFFCIAFPKFMIHQALFNFGWKVTCGPTYLYNRDDNWVESKRYQIMHSISVYERIPDFGERLDAPGAGQYIQSVTQLVNDGVEWVENAMENPDIQRELAEDLKRIVNFRARRRKP
jgi:hypothetical protein